MKDQINTIRELLNGMALAMPATADKALTALDQIEAAVGEQVACSKCHGTGYYDEGHECDDGTMAGGNYVACDKCAAPVAQQYEAGDIASASAQGFPDGVASVTQQEPVAWLVCSVNSDGSLSLEHAAAWEEAAHEHVNDAITEHGIEEAASWVVRPAYVAAPVAQQPQARPDFADEWTGYLKDGETPFERFLRERKDLTALTKLYQRALEENERLKAQQPQAEVGNSGFDHKTAADFLSGKTVSDEAVRKFVQASRWVHDDRASLQSMLLSVRNELASREAEIALLKKELMDADAAPQQAEAVAQRPPMPDPYGPVAAYVARIEQELADLKAAPRQAEAVPTGYVLVPVEPTQAMIDAMQSSGWMPANYRAMIAAAQGEKP